MNTIAFQQARAAAEKRQRDEIVRLRRVFNAKWGMPGECYYWGWTSETEGYFFQQERDFRDFQRVLRGDPLLHVRNPITVVTGPGPGCGKTTMIREIIRRQHGVADASSFVGRVPSLIESLLRQSITAGADFFWLDDCQGGALKINFLQMMATAGEVSFRPNYHKECQTFTKLPRIYLSGNCLELTADLERRCRVIRLA